MAKELRKDHKLALELWQTGMPEPKIVAAMIDEPAKLTEEQMEDWMKDINSWDVCDQVCMMRARFPWAGGYWIRFTVCW